MKLAITKVEPIGTRKTFAHVNTSDPRTHGFQWIDMPVYPDDVVAAGERIRARRIDLGLSLRQAAARLGLSVVEFCDVQNGAARCDEGEALRMLGGEARDG